MAESSSADVKPADEQITLQIQLPDGSAALKLKVKRGTKFEKIFGAVRGVGRACARCARRALLCPLPSSPAFPPPPFASSPPPTPLIPQFYKNKSMAPGSVKFMFNGAEVQPTETPEGLDMDENDVVDALMNQTGGGAAAGL